MHAPFTSRLIAFSLGATALVFATMPGASADDLFASSNWNNIASDRKASAVGDILTVVIYQNAEARNAERNVTSKRSDLDASAGSSGMETDFGSLSMGSRFDGRGEIQRSDSLVAQMSVSILDVLPNGEYIIGGKQEILVNGEKTVIEVRGRIREEDIAEDNRVLSTRIADAEINYNGFGFVSRNARPGILTYIFNFLGLAI